MKFGKKLRAEAAPGWADKYLAYKKLKQIIKTLPQNAVRWMTLAAPPEELTILFGVPGQNGRGRT